MLPFISDVPSAPEDISVHDVFQDSCVLKWKKPKDDGGMPINQYIIERQDLSVKGMQAVLFGHSYSCIVVTDDFNSK